MAGKAERFGGIISSIDLDERYIYAGVATSVQVWDRTSMQHVHTWEGIGREIRICVDQRHIYCTSLYHFTVVDKQRFEPVYEAQFGSDISSDLGHPIHDDDRVYFPIRNGALVAIDKRDYGNVRHLEEHEGTIWSMAQDEDFLYTGSVDKTIRVWEKRSLTVVNVLEGHRSNVQSLHVTGPYIISGSTDRSVIIWDRETGRLLHRIRNAHRRAINGLASYGGRLLTSSMAERRVRIWETGTWTPVKEMEIALAAGVGVRVVGETAYLAHRREPGIQAFPAEAIFL